MYLYLKAAHIIFVTSWMAGLFYLPRLFVYHVQWQDRADVSETFKTMERRLNAIIMVPAAIGTLLTGLGLYLAGAVSMAEHWFHGKLLLVVMMVVYHGYLFNLLLRFRCDSNNKEASYFRVLNEVPTLIFILIIILVVLKPF